METCQCEHLESIGHDGLATFEQFALGLCQLMPHWDEEIRTLIFQQAVGDQFEYELSIHIYSRYTIANYEYQANVY